MTEDQECVYHLGAHLCLPIIVSNWDEPAARKRRPSDTPSSEKHEKPSDDSRSCSISGSSTTTTKWITGFSDYVDGVWRSMTGEMRRKVRDACVEVLRRTDDEELENVFRNCDEDARFLD